MFPTSAVRRAALPALLVLLASAAGAQERDETEETDWDVRSMPGESQQVDIDVDSGTWMSLDVSPDGETVVFDLLGDIYTLPIGGGEATAVDSGLAWSMQPRYSPDGSEIAYISDAGGGDNVWIMNADGSEARQVTDEDFRLLNNPAWTPDGQYVAARKHYTTTRSLGTGEIWLYHRAGGDGIAVVERPGEDHQKEQGEPAFSPDGRYLYFSKDVTPGSTFQYAQDSNAVVYEILRHDLETGHTETFVSAPGGSLRPTPSPDGRRLAFVRRIRGESALFVKDLESGAERPVHEALETDLQEVWGVHGLYPNMDWTPDSRQVVFWAGGGIHRLDVETGELREIPFRVRDRRTVYAPPRPTVDVAPGTFRTQMARNAEVSPDGSRVVFESLGQLYVKELPDGAPQRLTRDPADHFEYDPTWSRDGRYVAFVAWDDSALGHLHKVRAGGGRSERLTSRPGHYHAPRFSPDGESVVFELRSGGFLTSPEWSIDTGVFLVDADGGEPRRITRSGSNPHFGARSDRLYVTRPVDGGNGRKLASIDLNGEAERVHATGEYLTRYEVAPDDRRLAFRENYHVYVLPLPRGGNPLVLGTEVESLPLIRASADGGNFPSWSADGRSLHWTLGPTLFTASVDELFANPAGEGDGGYQPPAAGDSLSMEVEADLPSSTVVIRGARIVTMADDTGGVVEDGVVVIESNRIAAVGEAGSVAIPEGASVVEAAGQTVIPGIVDAHAHGSQGVGFVPEQNWINYATLALGVTTAFDPSNDATEIFAAAEMQRAGRILAPRLFSTGDIVYGARSSYFAEVEFLEDAREHVRRLKAQGAIAIKNYNQPRREQRQQVTVAAREEGLLVVAEGGSLFHMDLSMVADGNSAIEHNLPQERFYDDVLQFWGQTEVAYTPTLVVTYGGLTSEHYWYMETDVWQHPILSNFVPPQVLEPRSVRRIKAPLRDFHHVDAAAAARQLAEEGVSVSIGAHGQREGLGSHWEIWGFAQGGMSPYEALRSATTDAARKIGMTGDIGSIEPGKLADLVILDVNPLADIYSSDRIDKVMLNGRLYDARTLDEVVTGDRQTEPFYWQRLSD